VEIHAVSTAPVFDPKQSPALTRELPGIATLLDADAMSSHLQDALLGSAPARFEIERCRPAQATYLAGDGCSLRYELELRDRVSGAAPLALVNTQVFQSSRACRQYVRERLQPLAERARGRPELEPFAQCAAVLEDVTAAVSVFPLDGELPTLIDATNPWLMGRILTRALSGRGGHPLGGCGCRVEVGHYSRRRCVLRYETEDAREDRGPGERSLVYGKVAADERGAVADMAMRRLRGQILCHRRPNSFRVPASLGYHRDLRLLLLEAMPGTAGVKGLLRAHERSQKATEAGLTLESAVRVCGSVAVALHRSEIELGPRRTAGGEMARLRADIAAVRRISPQLGSRLEAWLSTAEDRLAGSPALPRSLCHGDFRHSQILFEGELATLLDFDTVCQAEPALDLGHFLAYLKLAILKARVADARGIEAGADELCEVFLDRYLRGRGRLGLGEGHVRRRIAAYETLSLLRLALHGWQKFKPHRLGAALTLLEEGR
jgi:hypothetical protein